MRSPQYLTANGGERVARCRKCRCYAVSADGTDPATAPCNCPEEKQQRREWEALRRGERVVRR